MPDEVGYQNVPLQGWNYFLDEAVETNPEMVWPKNLDVYDRMRREDAQVISVIRACVTPVRSARWEIDPAGARPEVVDLVAGDLGLGIRGQTASRPLRTRGRFSFHEHLRLALTELVYGHAFFEQVYDLTSEPGRAHLKKLAWRPPRTISAIDVAPDGGLVSITQNPIAAGGSPSIPVARLVAYVNEREGGNWLGQSLLRAAYKNWLLKDRELRAQALTIERNGLGIPVYEGAPVPDSATATERDTWLQSEKTAGLALAKGLRAGDAAGASITNGANLSLLAVSGKLPDTGGPIAYHDEQIARAVLAHFLNLGTQTGSWALGSTFADFFTNSLNAVSTHIADVLQQHVVEDLVDLNWGSAEPAPQVVVASIGSAQDATAEAITSLVNAKVITPDQNIEAFMRAQYGLPPIESGTDDPTAAAEKARFAAETVQKVYLGVGPVLTKSEARDIVRDAGANLGASAPDKQEEQP